MKTASVAELKARLSEFLAAVRRGDDVVVTDRGRPVARLTALDPGEDARMTALVRSGAVRPSRRRPDPARFEAGAIADPEGRLMKALLEERSEGR
jgi:prevent-host-death family protein